MMLAKSLQSAAGNAAADANYIEDVFSTYLYTGNGSTQTITNGIDLAGEGGLVWCKARSVGNHGRLFDTARGVQKAIYSSLTSAEATESTSLTAFNADGFALGSNDNINGSGATNVSWTFRKQPKFFDVVTYTGTGTTQTINHNLGSAPGCIIVKSTSANSNWCVYHRGMGNTQFLSLNLTNAAATLSMWGNTDPTSTTFTTGGFQAVGELGSTYVAYLFAHDSGGFGLTGEDNVISCGSFTTDGSGNASVTLGYEPQWLMIKRTNAAENWIVVDTMRGWSVGNSDDAVLNPNTSGAENSTDTIGFPTATGFNYNLGSASSPFIYIAIRRGPMKVPESGTSVFFPTAWSGTSSTRVNTTGFVTDLNISRMRQNISSGSNLGAYWVNRLTGASPYLRSDATAAEATQTDGLTSFASNTAVTFGADTTVQAWNYDNNYRNYSFRRAPGFFDEVCYTGTGVDLTVNHNLGVVPEWVIIKNRSRAGTNWSGAYFANPSEYYDVRLNQDIGRSLVTMGPAGPTLISNSATTFGVLGGSTLVNHSGDTYVAYLFASCPGVSKVGSYTGNGSSQTINCGFLAGARFVMIKAASTTGNWVFADVNGINAGNDRALYMNNADVEGFAYDWIDIDSTGFIVNETAVIAANTNGVSYIFLAIA